MKFLPEDRPSYGAEQERKQNSCLYLKACLFQVKAQELVCIKQTGSRVRHHPLVLLFCDCLVLIISERSLKGAFSGYYCFP